MDIAVLEDKLIETLKQGMTYLKYADTYQGELDEKSIAQFAMNFPALLIYMEDTTYTNRSYPMMWQNAQFTILLCDRNLRGNKNARRGDLSNPGTYKMLADVYSLLHDKTLDLLTYPLVAVSEHALINSRQLSVYAAVYKTKQPKN
ncbi:MAG: phage protein Gp37 [Nitrospirota bacterium]